MEAGIKWDNWLFHLFSKTLLPKISYCNFENIVRANNRYHHFIGGKKSKYHSLSFVQYTIYQMRMQLKEKGNTLISSKLWDFESLNNSLSFFSCIRGFNLNVLNDKTAEQHNGQTTCIDRNIDKIDNKIRNIFPNWREKQRQYYSFIWSMLLKRPD